MKTKKQLLAEMRVDPWRWACQEAWDYVCRSPSDSALQIGLKCPHKHWMLWFLYRRLTASGRALLAKRLGCRDDDHLWTAGMLSDDAAPLDRRVINDCWRAWCAARDVASRPSAGVQGHCSSRGQACVRRGRLPRA